MSREDALHRINAWLKTGELREIDAALARFIAAQDQTAGGEVLLAAALVSQQLGKKHVCMPLTEPWGDALRTARASVGDGAGNQPLVFDGERVYLRRYWQYEQEVAAAVHARTSAGTFRVITGGPGTGKTWTATKIVGETSGRIAVAAPTGKAANRLQHSLEARGLSGLKATTLHRLLGVQSWTHEFRHNQDNPLPDDLVIVDEASMIPLDLMASLLRALRPDATLVLLGDADQLASVEAGAVLADICAAGGEHITVLTTSHRFGAHPGIGVLASAANAGDSPVFDAAFSTHSEIERVTFQAEDFAGRVLAGYAPFVTALPDPAAALDAMQGFQVLCAVRAGEYGVERINGRIERVLAEAELIDPAKRWYTGRPVMVTQNDYALGLFNGDIGVCVDGRAWFSIGGTLKSFLPSRLPECETSFAMTVHKSQGSEFTHTVLVLPDQTNPVLTRELLYTGITRARERFTLILAENAVLDYALGHRTQRASGLADRLRAQSPA